MSCQAGRLNPPLSRQKTSQSRTGHGAGLFKPAAGLIQLVLFQRCIRGRLKGSIRRRLEESSGEGVDGVDCVDCVDEEDEEDDESVELQKWPTSTPTRSTGPISKFALRLSSN